MADRVLKRYGNRRRMEKGQGTLEMAIVLVLMVLLLGGIFNIWLWANNQIVLRQKKYNASRVEAGTSTDGYVLHWPVHQAEELTEGAVIPEGPQLR